MDRLFESKTTLLQVIQQCDLDTIFNLRLTSRSTYKLISTYEVSISAAVANRTFPNAVLKLRPQNNPPPSIKWLVQLYHRATIGSAVAALLVDLRPLGRGGRVMFGIPAYDPYGDALRERVENGWYVFWHLSDIALDVGREEVAKEPRRFLGFRPREIKVVRKQEEEIKKRRIEFLKTLEEANVVDYDIMFNFLAGSFLGSELCDLNGGGASYRDGHLFPAFGRRDSWLNWWVLRVGPPPLVRAWKGLGKDYVIRQIREEWASRSKTRVQIERDAGESFHDEVKIVVGSQGRDYISECLRNWSRGNREVSSLQNEQMDRHPFWGQKFSHINIGFN
ncbi:MAG: hypothetical protein M1812_003723 [Candelaria pacifica]|nr:MAG: hypothetical protein M1812_003723 [Candelaria pacifica]